MFDFLFSHSLFSPLKEIKMRIGLQPKIKIWAEAHYVAIHYFNGLKPVASQIINIDFLTKQD
jgi:hypothetical protein